MSARKNYQIGDIVGLSGLPYMGDGEPRKGRRVVKTVCKCGKPFEVLHAALSGKRPTRSCGCINKDQARSLGLTSNKSHGKRRHPLYTVWCNMKNRCNNPNVKSFKDYGGRGIKVCEEWQSDFGRFYDWAVNNGYDKTLEIDRKDNNDGYYPGNCRFVTKRRNSINRRVKSSNKWGITGISYCKNKRKFRSEITTENEGCIVLAYTPDFFEACCARKSAEVRYWSD